MSAARSIILLAILTAAAIVPAGSASDRAVAWIEDFEGDLTAWSMPMTVGTTEGCLGAASGARSLQIADCGSFYPISYSALGMGFAMSRQFPRPDDNYTSLHVAYSVRATDEIYAGGAGLTVRITCPAGDVHERSWTVGLMTDALRLISPTVPEPAPTTWTRVEDVIPGCRAFGGPTIQLWVGTSEGSAPATSLFAIDAIELVGSQE